MTMNRFQRWGRTLASALLPVLLSLSLAVPGGCESAGPAAAAGASGSARAARAAAPEPSANATEPAALTNAQRDLHIQSFDHVWMTVATKHFDPTIGGLDWGAVRAELRPRVVNANTAREARAAMSEMLRRLGQSHFGIIPADAYDGLGGRRARADKPHTSDEPGEAGITIRLIGGRAVVAAVRPGGPAARAGVKPGYVVEEVDGETIAPVIRRVLAATASHSQGLLDVHLIRAIESRFDGSRGEKIEAVFLDGAEQMVKSTIVLEPPVGIKASLGNLPEMYLECHFETLRSGGGAPWPMGPAAASDTSDSACSLSPPW